MNRDVLVLPSQRKGMLAVPFAARTKFVAPVRRVNQQSCQHVASRCCDALPAREPWAAFTAGSDVDEVAEEADAAEARRRIRMARAVAEAAAAQAGITGLNLQLLSPLILSAGLDLLYCQKV